MPNEHARRDEWLIADEKGFLSKCRFLQQKGSGKGGQKINKTSSAVRLVHEPTGLFVLAGESRYQSENRIIAVRKLKKVIALEIRLPFHSSEIISDEIPSLKNDSYPLWLAKLLDLMEEQSYSVSSSSKIIGCSTGQLIRILSRDADLWQKVNRERQKRGFKILRAE